MERVQPAGSQRLDHADWEETQKKGTTAIEKWIDEQLKGSSVTAVLIGAETSQRAYVKYEINASHLRGNGLLGIYIHGMKDANRNVDTQGHNPFKAWKFELDGKTVNFADHYPTYDWVNNNGRANMGTWIETAAKNTGQ